MRVQVLQHLPCEDIGSMREWFAARGARLDYTRFYQADACLPPLAGLDLVVVMGGPMSVNDEASLPWLIEEKRFLREAIDAGIAVLGICLGAQLIASALGARVKANPLKEIGWFSVWRSGVSPDGCFDFPERELLFHWHGETFELPPGAVRLALSDACSNQAFQYGSRVIGLQCHPEMTEDIIQALIKEFPDELQPGQPWVQSPTDLLAQPAASYHAGQRLVEGVLEYLVG